MNPGTFTAIHADGLSKDYGAGRELFDLKIEIERGAIYGFAPPIDGFSCPKYLSPFYLATVTTALLAAAVLTIRRRDLR